MLPAGGLAEAAPADGISIASLLAAVVVGELVARGAACRLADGRWPAAVAAPGEVPGACGLRDIVR